MIKNKEYIEKVKNIVEGAGKIACVITYGCQQNENDSEKIKGYLYEMGYTLSEDTSDADVVVFNTCAVRGGAEERVLGNVGALKHKKEHNPDMIIGIMGCMTQQEAVSSHIMKKMKHVDFVMGTQASPRFPEIIYNTLIEKKRISDLEANDKIYEGSPIKRDDEIKASVSIMSGCNNFCTYCIVPYVRGRERSREKENIIAEVKELKNSGYKEVMLLGQNVNSYGRGLYEDYDFANLLYDVAATGIERVRFMTSHPKDISDNLISVMAECDNVCKSLHLPFQSGSNRILKAMNRIYTREEYLKKIEKVKNKIPNIALTSDVIIGFPNETYEDVLETISLIKEVRYDSLFTFIYSKREGTVAAEIEDKISDEEKHKHFDMLLEAQNVISREINETYVGKEYKILVDGESKTNPDMMCGRTDSNKIVNFSPVKAKKGDIINVKITKAQTWSLSGEEKEEL